MPGENGTGPNGDRSEPEDEAPRLDEIERGRLIDQQRKAARNKRLNEHDAELKRTGQVVDVKAAMMRCFTAGTSEPERLVNDERPA